MDLASAVDVADWRRRNHALYRTVRETPDPVSAWAAWRTGRDAMFRDHASTPLLPEDRPGFEGLVFPDYDPAFRFETRIEEAEPAHMDVPTGTDGVVPFDRVGVVRLGDLGTLDVWWLASYGNGLFIPVKDATAGRPGGTYGGGRYLVDTGKGADLGQRGADIVIDLNFAYNPSCAYDPEWACPLAPAGNTLHVDVPVGERVFNTDY
jgi:uncharacterized protein